MARLVTTVDISVKGISAVRKSIIDAGAQTWAGLDRSYHFLRLRDLGHFRSRREALDRRPQHGVGLRVTAGGAIELRQRQRRAEFEGASAATAMALRKAFSAGAKLAESRLS